MTVNGVLRHFLVDIEATVCADIEEASFQGNHYEPADPPEVSVTDAEVEVCFADGQDIDGCFTISGNPGLDLFFQFWYPEDIENAAIDSSVEDDQADCKYEAQRELRDEYGPFGGDPQC